MEKSSESRSGWLRFLDSFLQDRNIKWILALGMTIVVGSADYACASRCPCSRVVWKPTFGQRSIAACRLNLLVAR